MPAGSAAGSAAGAAVAAGAGLSPGPATATPVAARASTLSESAPTRAMWFTIVTPEGGEERTAESKTSQPTGYSAESATRCRRGCDNARPARRRGAVCALELACHVALVGEAGVDGGPRERHAALDR